MSEWLDKLVVCLALIVSAGYAAVALGPKPFRRQVALTLLGAAPRTPRVLGLRRLVARLGAAVAAKVPGGCGGCDGCGENAGATSQSGASDSPARGEAAAAEIVVPLDKISRRRGA
ncbi:MAG TPA: DUF6587 family protein [Steroidobacteraceae bacterium]|jgi:hypothetical protein|nr:DUF6587 family protein [Steroidobacteraceae bacterium]